MNKAAILQSHFITAHPNNTAMINTLVHFQQHSHVPLIVMINSTVKTISVSHAVTISGRIPTNSLLLLMCWWQLHTVLEFCVVLLFLWWLVSALRECMCLLLIICATIEKYKFSLSIGWHFLLF